MRIILIAIAKLGTSFASAGYSALCPAGNIYVGGELLNIPKDPAILLSYINTQLRDSGNDLDELCKSLCIEKDELIGSLSSIGYSYDKEKNRFK